MDVPYVNIHTHRRTGEGIELVSFMAGRQSCTAADRPCSVGIHPWQAGGNGRSDNITVNPVNDLEAALREVETAPADAIGEIGLDYFRPVGREAQQEIFAAQLRIAEARGLPVILHCVKAFEPVMKTLAGFRLPAVIFHGFVGSPEQARRAHDRGYFLSFGPVISLSSRTAEAMKATPLRQMFFETDEYELGIGRVYDKAAALLETDAGELKRGIYENYIRLFGK